MEVVDADILKFASFSSSAQCVNKDAWGAGYAAQVYVVA